MKSPFASPVQPASFLPQDYVQRRAETRANMLILSLFGVVMFGVVGAFFVTNRHRERVLDSRRAVTEQYVQEAEKIEQLKQLEETRTDMMQRAEVTTALIERVPRSVLLAELVTKLPRGVTLLETNLTSRRIDVVVEDKSSSLAKTKGGRSAQASKTPSKMTGAKGTEKDAKGKDAKAADKVVKPVVQAPRYEYSLVIMGVAEKNTDISDYLAKLQQSEILDKCELPYIEVTKIEKVELRKFEIRATLRGDADVRTARLKVEQAAEQQARAEREAEDQAAAATDTPGAGEMK